jgi:hypothetical protein
MADRHTARTFLRGMTQRDRNISYIKYDINKMSIDNPSYKPTAKVTDTYGNERTVGLIINSSTQEYYKEFEALPDTQIYAGDYVEWGRGIWVVQSCSTDDEIYKRGYLWQCNWKMKWQNDAGEIIERWCFASSASKYNEGVEQDKVFTLGSDQCKVYMPVDEEVLAVTKKKEMCFIIDNAIAGQPRIYEAHNPSNVYSTFDVLRGDDGKLHGVTDWILKETTYTLTDEEKELGVCHYRHTDNVEPTPEPSDITGVDVLPLTKFKTYSYPEEEWNNLFLWRINCAFDVISEAQGNVIKIKVDDKNAIGSYLKLQAVEYDTVVAEKVIEIKGLYG